MQLMVYGVGTSRNVPVGAGPPEASALSEHEGDTVTGKCVGFEKATDDVEAGSPGVVENKVRVHYFITVVVFSILLLLFFNL